MEEESVNLGVRNNNGKGGRSSYPSLSRVLELAAIFIFRYSVIAMRLGVACVSRDYSGYMAVRVCVVSMCWQFVFLWCQCAGSSCLCGVNVLAVSVCVVSMCW
jgi:hypothetical protein